MNFYRSIMLAVSSVVTIPSLATAAQGATLPLQEKPITFAANTTQKDWKGKEPSSKSIGAKHETTKIKNAAFGEQIWVMLGSPIPPGWIMVQSTGTRNLIRYIG
ncbi:hypothetical protein POF51_30520 [Brevibacillus sp. AG]|uniref:hypothetical protein n=1 Tax=Brevibacillus sp. AG TaxID=3020891 RepID=UPI00232F39B8|nr:hypothetical protein [Brevibacillus sp. AG]MDC0765063.1 hypothetical protein [Brevibacillus sp. AG]